MRSYGLTSQELQEIKEKLNYFFGDLKDIKVYLFGSRATGKHQKYSDIDLAVKSKASDLNKRIALFKEASNESNLPYKMDIASWKDLYAPYLPSIRKQKIIFWTPESKSVHPWRVCPYGEHWVVRHPRLPVGRKVQDVDGHCRKNPSGKDRLAGDEIELISKTLPFTESFPLPLLYPGKQKLENPNDYDVLIAGWCKYWNEVMSPDILITPNFIKALMESESSFNPTAFAKNRPSIGMARGLIQLTESTLRILRDRRGEIKDHYIDLKKEELFDPSKNICAGIRWMFRKREILTKRLGRSPSWVEAVVEYKGLGPDLKKGGEKSLRIMNDFLKYYSAYGESK